MKSDVLPKNRISNRDSSCTYCAGRARGTVHLLWRVLLFLRQCGHGRVQRRARAGVRENKRGLSSRRGVTELLEVTVTLFERRCLQQVSLFFLELLTHRKPNTCILSMIRGMLRRAPSDQQQLLN